MTMTMRPETDTWRDARIYTQGRRLQAHHSNPRRGLIGGRKMRSVYVSAALEFAIAIDPETGRVTVSGSE